MPSPDSASAVRREYALTTGRRIHLALLSAICLIGAGFFFKLAIDPAGRAFALAAGVVFLLPGAMLLLQAWRSRLVLEGDVIELHSPFRTHRATRSEIEGLRAVQNQYGRWTRICLNHDRAAFNVSNSFTGDDDLEDWLKGLPDLDQRDADEIRQEVRIQDPLASSDTDTSSAFDRAKAWAVGLSVLAGAVSIPVIWVGYGPVHRPALVALLACPPVGIILLHRFPVLFTAFRRKPDPRADLGFLIAWPGIGVMFSYQTANDPFHLVDGSQVVLWVLLVLVGLVAALFQTAWRNPSRVAVLLTITLLGGMYSIGLVNAVNALPDNSVPRLYQSSILKMYETSSSKGTRYYLRVAPWGPLAYSDDVDVPRSTYDASRVGASVCFGLHAGFLRAPWYTLAPCPARPLTQTPWSLKPGAEVWMGTAGRLGDLGPPAVVRR